MSTWAPAYFLLGPFACAIWMVFICHRQNVRRWQCSERLGSWRDGHGGIFCTVGKSIWFMVSGFFGSAIAEGVFLLGTYAVFPHRVSQATLMLILAVAPFAVFAPVLLGAAEPLDSQGRVRERLATL